MYSSLASTEPSIGDARESNYFQVGILRLTGDGVHTGCHVATLHSNLFRMSMGPMASRVHGG